MILFSDFFNIHDFPFSSVLSGKENFFELLDIFFDYVNQYEFKGIAGTIEKNVFFKNSEKIEIHSSVVIESGAYICGPCILSEGCVVRHGAYIRGNVFVGNNGVVGHCTEVKNSVLLSQAKASHFAYISDSILGRRVNLGAGVRCANLRLDRQTVKIATASGIIDSKKNKLGTCFGNNVQVGCNAVLNPGSLVKKDVCIAPGEVKKGLIS